MIRTARRFSVQVSFAAALLLAASCRGDRLVAPTRVDADAAHISAADLPTACPAGATKWVSAVNGNWLTAANWTAGVPAATTPACIDLPGSYIVTLHAAFATTTVPALSVFLGDPGASVQPILRMTQGTLIVGTDVTAHGRFELSPGTGAIVNAAGTIAVAPTGTLIGANSGTRQFEAAIIQNDGTINAGSGLSLRGATIVNRGSIILASGRQLLVRGPTSGGAPTVTFDAGTVDAAGTLQQQDGTLIVTGGTVTGILNLIAVDELRIEHDAGGRFNLTPLGGIVPPTTSRLNGTIGTTQHVWMGSNHLTVETSGLVNQGLLTVEHLGAFQKTGTVLRIEPDAILLNEGTLTLVSGANSNAGLFGAITNAPAGVITNVGSGVPGIAPTPLINNGTLRVATSHLRVVAAPDGSAPEVVLNGGTVESTAGQYQQNGGTLAVSGGTVHGTLDLIALTELRLEHDGGGRFDLFALGGQVPTTISRLSGTIGPTQHVWMGSNHLTVETSGLVNQGQLTVEHLGAFQKTGTLLRTAPGATLVNEGTLTLVSGANSNAGLFGAITNAAAGVITNVGSGVPGVAPTPLINNGTLRVATSQLRVVAAPDGSAADVRFEGGRLELTGSYSQTGGAFRYHGATVTGSGAATFSGVRFSGFGTWGRTLPLTGASVLAPGASPGRFAISGDYSPSTTTVTEIELAGGEPGTGYDQITVTGTARFLGSLSVTLTDGFVPHPCQTFHVVTYGTRTGTFANATTPIDVGGGMKLRQVYTATNLVLVAYNANGPNVHPTQVEVSVDGATDTYDVCIGAGVDVITVSPDDQVTVDKATLTFGASQLPQTVTVSVSPTATRSEALIRHTASSGTPVGSVDVLISGIVPSDVDPPTTTASATPAANVHGWNNTDVTVSLTSSDAGSGVAEILWSLSGAQAGSATVAGSAASVIVSAEGQTTLTYFARDVAGNQESPKTLDVRIDQTPPSVTVTRDPLANSNGWNNTDVTATFTATDALSGIDGAASDQVVFTNEGADQSAARTFHDRAGNSASATIGNISIDKTPPAVSCSATPNEIWPPNRQLVPVSIAVLVEDAISGAGGFLLERTSSNEPEPKPVPGSGPFTGDIMDFVTGTPDTYGSVRAWRLGNGTGRVYTFEYRGFDLAGNSATGACEVRVPHDQGRGRR
ncbi:MAG: hypothetical protein WD801_05445 [Gemmatimonadaceae bacterium]